MAKGEKFKYFAPEETLELMKQNAGICLDGASVKAAIMDAVEVMKLQIKTLKDSDWSEVTPDKVSQSLAYVAKMVDQVSRLASFMSGGPDSRPDLGMGYLQWLEEWQLAQLEGWVEENQRKHAELEVSTA